MKSIVIKLENASGVYLLKNKGKIIYIGRSGNVLQRSASHSKDKRFDEIEIVWCAHQQSKKLESFLIRKHQPKYNRNLLYENSEALALFRLTLKNEAEIAKLLPLYPNLTFNKLANEVFKYGLPKLNSTK